MLMLAKIRSKTSRLLPNSLNLGDSTGYQNTV
jgi:hypothetical protein